MTDTPDHSEKPQNGLFASVALPPPPDWAALPDLLLTNDVAGLLGKSGGNIRARTSKGEFGNVKKDDQERNLYPKAVVKAVYDKMVKNRNTVFLHSVSPQRMSATSQDMPAAIKIILDEIKEQRDREVSLWQARLTDAKQEAERLREMLFQHEEATRQAVAENAAIYAARVGETDAHRAEIIAAKESEIERLRGELEAAKSVPEKKRNFFGFWR